MKCEEKGLNFLSAGDFWEDQTSSFLEPWLTDLSLGPPNGLTWLLGGLSGLKEWFLFKARSFKAWNKIWLWPQQGTSMSPKHPKAFNIDESSGSVALPSLKSYLPGRFQIGITRLLPGSALIHHITALWSQRPQGRPVSAVLETWSKQSWLRIPAEKHVKCQGLRHL